MDRRSFVIGTAASATALAAGPAFAQEVYPSHAITIINAFPPGGINDNVTRPFISALEPILKQPVVNETKAGAAGSVDVYGFLPSDSFTHAVNCLVRAWGVEPVDPIFKAKKSLSS